MGIRPAPAAELPNEMLGAWCGDNYYNHSNDETHYTRIELFIGGNGEDDIDRCGNHGGLKRLLYEHFQSVLH
jgi:hypothetical protein